MNNKISRNEKIFAVILSILVVLLGIYKLFFDKKTIKEETIDTETISIVMDRDEFYTVSSCVTKFLTYLNSYDTKNLYSILDQNYANENGITEVNINEYISQFESIMNFTPKKMFVQRINKNVYKYYVYGEIYPDVMDSMVAYQDYYIIILLDQENLTYSMQPYDGKLFK